MRVLVACECSGAVRQAFRDKGHDAWSCDIKPCEDESPFHFQEDVFNVIGRGWDLMIAHPPCTYLANSGVQHLHKGPERWSKLKEGRDFFLKLWMCNILRVCCENPVPHKYAALPPYGQIIQPYYFGDKAMKKTCLWLRGLPPLFATAWMQDQGEKYITKAGRSNGSKWYQLLSIKDRQTIRSRTFPGIARAMADQWGEPFSHGKPCPN